jgi:hypothetical protein
MSQTDTERDPFFIGWEKMPRRYVRFLLPVVCVLTLALVIGGAVLAWGQRSPGPGVWDDGTTTLTGIVYAEPYAMLRVRDGTGAPRTILLVNEGKFSAKERVNPFDGKPARVSGTLLARDGWQMLELVDGDHGLRAAEMSETEQAGLRRTPAKSLGAGSLRGEIVDSKCFLGAMKPGSWRTHKGCAVLCLKGGIPPVFATHDGKLYLLTNAEGGPLDPLFFDRAAENISLTGDFEEWDDILVLRTVLRNGN